MGGLRRKAVALCVLFFLLACSAPGMEGAGARPSSDGSEGTPADLVTAWVAMWNSYDLDRVRNLFLTDERVTYFSSEFEGVIRGFEALVEHHEGFGFVPGGEARGTRLWVEDLTVSDFGDAAVLTGIWYFERSGEGPTGVAGGDSGSGSGAGEVFQGDPGASVSPPQRGPVTFVCVLEEGRWRFAHMNFGNYLDTGMTEEG